MPNVPQITLQFSTTECSLADYIQLSHRTLFMKLYQAIIDRSDTKNCILLYCWFTIWNILFCLAFSFLSRPVSPDKAASVFHISLG